MHAHHDRLDLKLQSMEYTDPACGSLNKITGMPEYCFQDCPALRGSESLRVIATVNGVLHGRIASEAVQCAACGGLGRVGRYICQPCQGRGVTGIHG